MRTPRNEPELIPVTDFIVEIDDHKIDVRNIEVAVFPAGNMAVRLDIPELGINKGTFPFHISPLLLAQKALDDEQRYALALKNHIETFLCPQMGFLDDITLTEGDETLTATEISWSSVGCNPGFIWLRFALPMVFGASCERQMQIPEDLQDRFALTEFLKTKVEEIMPIYFGGGLISKTGDFFADLVADMQEALGEVEEPKA